MLLQKRNKWHIGSYNKTVELRKELSLHGIDIDKYVNTKDAFAVLYDDEYLIFYKDSLDIDYKVFVILHEFAHIVLNNIYHGILGKAPNEEKTNMQEAEANAFAARSAPRSRSYTSVILNPKKQLNDLVY